MSAAQTGGCREAPLRIPWLLAERARIRKAGWFN